MSYRNKSIEISEKNIDKAIETTIRTRYKWKGFFGKSVMSPITKCSAKTYFDHSFKQNGILVSLCLCEKNLQKKRINIALVPPMKSYLKDFMGKMKWLNEEEIFIVPQRGYNYKILVRVKEGNVIYEGTLPDWLANANT